MLVALASFKADSARTTSSQPLKFQEVPQSSYTKKKGTTLQMFRSGKRKTSHSNSGNSIGFNENDHLLVSVEVTHYLYDCVHHYDNFIIQPYYFLCITPNKYMIIE